jgi:hypothetical protein
MFIQNIQEAPNEFKDKKNKEYEKTQKQINEITRTLKETPNREHHKQRAK